MKIKLLAGAACAALMVFAYPASAASSGGFSTAPSGLLQAPASALDNFYQARGGRPLWLGTGGDRSAPEVLLNILARAPLDGYAAGPAIASDVRAKLASGDPQSMALADRMLSAAWIDYVQAIEAPTRGMTYADSWASPHQQGAAQILAQAAAAPSLTAYLNRASAVNPVYDQLRAAAWADMQGSAAPLDPRVSASLDRARETPFQKRYVMVDTASATLYMIEDGRIADSMKVIVGKPTSQTPMIASTVYYATFNPYWNVPDDLLRKLIAPRIVKQGVSYVTQHNYDVLASADPDAATIDPTTVDWQGVVDGRVHVRLRQRPNAANSMGTVKFGFPNASEIFMHDSPEKDLFAEDSRNLSNGCIRLSDAPRFARWMLGREAADVSNGTPEQHVALSIPVPVYITYLTAQARDGQLAFVDDVYGRDPQSAGPVMAALR